mmetsp:Transcript_64625/g.159085  ORF Transcript_64625/g.159085 Transcript_64625/m.159085 type:complete len:248 (-) Transcript_64625:1067-1810(-)
MMRMTRPSLHPQPSLPHLRPSLHLRLLLHPQPSPHLQQSLPRSRRPLRPLLRPRSPQHRRRHTYLLRRRQALQRARRWGGAVPIASQSRPRRSRKPLLQHQHQHQRLPTRIPGSDQGQVQRQQRVWLRQQPACRLLPQQHPRQTWQRVQRLGVRRGSLARSLYIEGVLLLLLKRPWRGKSRTTTRGVFPARPLSLPLSSTRRRSCLPRRATRATRMVPTPPLGLCLSRRTSPLSLHRRHKPLPRNQR